MTEYKEEIKAAVEELLKRDEYPVAMHIALATQEYPIIDNISDKELAFLLRKYLSCQELDIHPHISDYTELLEEDEDIWD